ncbi:hypothetical protein ACFX5K_05315 [Rickettsiales bacterium LUAb2]
MLKNSFHNYGVVSIIYHYVLTGLLFAIFLLDIAYYFEQDNSGLFNIAVQLEYIMMVVVIMHLIWGIFNRKVMSFALSNFEEKMESFFTFLMNVTLIITPFIAFSEYCLNITLNILNDPNFVYNGLYVFGALVAPIGVVKGYGSFLDILQADPGVFQHSLSWLHIMLLAVVLPLLLAIKGGFLLYNEYLRKNEAIRRLFLR